MKRILFSAALASIIVAGTLTLEYVCEANQVGHHAQQVLSEASGPQASLGDTIQPISRESRFCQERYPLFRLGAKLNAEDYRIFSAC